ncbi:MAG: TIGR04255 family protein [Candidatus Binatia bacterium]
MSHPRHLRKAPIIEALFDFRVKTRVGFRGEDFAPLQSQLADRFPKMEERRGLQATFAVLEGKSHPPVVQDLGLQGYFFKAADEKTIAQFRVDGFTVNRLHPYTSWGELFPLVLELWRLYAATARPEVVTRLGLRYINRIPLAAGPVELETYLRAAPTIPPELPQDFSSFLTRVAIHDNAKALAAHITQASEANASGGERTILLDIDTFKASELALADPAIEETFNQLRDFKNLIFFNSLTEEIVRQLE